MEERKIFHSNLTDQSITMQEYLDKQIEWMEKIVENKTRLEAQIVAARLEGEIRVLQTMVADDRAAVIQYSKTNDEWKNMHNDLSRKMADDKAHFVTREMMADQSKIIISRVGAVVGIIAVAVSIYVAFIK